MKGQRYILVSTTVISILLSIQWHVKFKIAGRYGWRSFGHAIRNYQKIRDGYCRANKESRLYDKTYIYTVLHYLKIHTYMYIATIHIATLLLVIYIIRSHYIRYVITILFLYLKKITHGVFFCSKVMKNNVFNFTAYCTYWKLFLGWHTIFHILSCLVSFCNEKNLYTALPLFWAPSLPFDTRDLFRNTLPWISNTTDEETVLE